MKTLFLLLLAAFVIAVLWWVCTSLRAIKHDDDPSE
jgi:hypothetical protein